MLSLGPHLFVNCCCVDQTCGCVDDEEIRLCHNPSREYSFFLYPLLRTSGRPDLEDLFHRHGGHRVIDILCRTVSLQAFKHAGMRSDTCCRETRGVVVDGM